MEKRLRDYRPRALAIALVWCNWLLLVFVGKRLLPPSHGVLYILENVGTFVCALVISGLMLHFFSKSIIGIAIPLILLVTLVIATR